jgi:putative transposase
VGPDSWSWPLNRAAFSLRAAGCPGSRGVRDLGRCHNHKCGVRSITARSSLYFYPAHMPWGLERWHGGHDLHFITFSCYDSQPLLATAQRRDLFLEGERRRQHRSERIESGPQRIWQARYYDFNVCTADKRVEKLRYIHRNPVKRGLVEAPELWRWSSFRAYAYQEKGPVGINRWRVPSLRPSKQQLSQHDGCPRSRRVRDLGPDIV